MNIRFKLAVVFGLLALLFWAYAWGAYRSILFFEAPHTVLYCVLGTACTPQAYYPQLWFFLILAIIFSIITGELLYSGTKQPKQTTLKEYS
ncbi:MAG: hypothetical protein ABSF63_12945 [Candidatus Bathyarchaeia archaeon]|jgi:hypothetical protein